jgi:hypothetical protein
MSNQAAVLYAPHDIRLEERSQPQPGPKEVLVEIKAVGVCGSDVHYYEHGRIGSFIVNQPLILGHESDSASPLSRASPVASVASAVMETTISARTCASSGRRRLTVPSPTM